MPIIRDRVEGQRRVGRGVLFPRLRLGAAVLAGRASPRRRCSTTSARRCVLPPGYLCCGYPQTVGGLPRQGPADHHRQPRAVPPRREHAQLPRHQDGDRVVRHVHGSAAEVRVREDLPGLPAARHPRVPDGEGRRARGRRGRALHVSRPLPHADEDPRAAQGRERADGHERAAERSLLRRVGHARDDAPGHLHPGALPQGSGDAQGRGQAARRRLRRARSRC